MKKNIGTYLAVGLAACCLLGGLLTGCSGSGASASQNGVAGAIDSRAEVMNINGYSVRVADYYIYLVQYLYNYGIRPEQLNQETIDSIMEMATNDLKAEMVRRSMVTEAGLTPTEAQEQTIGMMHEAFYATFGEEFLQSYGIESENVQDMILRQLDTYLMTMRATQELQEQYTAQYEEEYGQERFHEIYYVLFPTYQIDENGQVVIGEDGSYAMLSEEETAEQQARAEEFREYAVQGVNKDGTAMSMEGLANEYGVAAYSGAQHNMYGGYVEELNALVEPLEDGEISEVLPTEAGFIIVRMDNANDEEFKEQLIALKASQMASSETEQAAKMQSWVTEAGVDAIQPDQALINAIDVLALCNDMISRGIVFDQSSLYQ